jgi:hypothetical protein
MLSGPVTVTMVTPVRYWLMTARKLVLATGWSLAMAEFVMKASRKKMIN